MLTDAASGCLVAAGWLSGAAGAAVPAVNTQVVFTGSLAADPAGERIEQEAVFDSVFTTDGHIAGSGRAPQRPDHFAPAAPEPAHAETSGCEPPAPTSTLSSTRTAVPTLAPNSTASWTTITRPPAEPTLDAAASTSTKIVTITRSKSTSTVTVTRTRSTSTITVTRTHSSTTTSTPVSTVTPTALAYSPYADDGSCKDADTVKSDLQKLVTRKIATVRTYTTECNMITTVNDVLSELGLTINQGLWISADGVDSIDGQLSDFIAWGQQGSNWDLVAMVAVGNEAITSGYVSASDLQSKISSVRSQLRSAGYTGPIGTVEQTGAFQSNTGLCQPSVIDFVGLNAHPYFDASASPLTAGAFVVAQAALVKAACGGNDVFITETGYPSKGNTNGLNTPSEANQRTAVANILDVYGGNLTMFTMYDDLWKNAGSYGVEQSFGIIELLA
ncbi:glycoside hydrolase superfamily [Dipodascopsis tothii]|uniref:glycoside hydrolase superfamily n=1 Tax=Dipodascopsis tothii TaxID=44089 RepID=UPI0034CFF305